MNPWADELALAETALEEGRYEESRLRLVGLHGSLRRASRDGEKLDSAVGARLRLCLAKCCWALGRTEDAGLEARAALGQYSGPQPALASTLYERRAGAADAEMILADVAVRMAERERAEVHLDRAMAILGEINEGLLDARLAMLRGRMSLDAGEDLEAEEYFAAALAGFRRADHPVGECEAWLNLCRFYRLRGDVSASESALGRATAVAGASPGRRLASALVEAKGNLCLEQSRLPGAIVAFEQALGLSKSCGDRNGEGRMSIRLGEALRMSGEVRARTLLTAGIGMLAECHSKRDLAEGFLAVARQQDDSANPLAAMLAAEVTRRLLGDSRALREYGHALGLLTKSLSDLGAYREAFVAAQAHEAIAGNCQPSAREVARRFRRHALPGWKDLRRRRSAAVWLAETQQSVERMFSTLNAEVPFEELSTISGAVSSLRLVWAIRSEVVDPGMAPWGRADPSGDTDDYVVEQG